VTGPITVWEDNQSCIKQAASPCDREAQKHIDVRAHYLREQVHQNNATMNYVSTHLQIAGALSKNLPKPAFELHRDAMGLAFSTTPSHTKKHSVTWATWALGLTSSRQRVDVRRALHPFPTSRVAGVCWTVLAYTGPLPVNGNDQTSHEWH
jgi:hypothetical protein